MVHSTLAAMIQCFDRKVSRGNETVGMEEGPGLTLPIAQTLVFVFLLLGLIRFHRFDNDEKIGNSKNEKEKERKRELQQ